MSIRNWSGNVTFSTDRLARPASVEELQEVVTSSARVRALGTGHSFNAIADTDGVLVTLADLHQPISIDETRRTVRLGSATRYAQLAAELDKHGWALANLGSLPHISVGGACATGTHGSGVDNQCLASSVRAVELVRGDGELVRVEQGDQRFGGAVLALGAVGIVTSLELAIEPSYEIRQDVWLDAPLDAVADRIDAVMAAGYSVSLFSEPAYPGVVKKIWVKSRTDRGPVRLPDGLGRPATEPQHPITGIETTHATLQLGQPGPWHARLPHFKAEFTPSVGDEQQSEYLLPREHAADALLAVHTLGVTGAMLVFELRTIAADDLWLSPFHGRDSVGVHVTWVNDDALVRDGCSRLETVLSQFDPRPHWGKVHTMEPDRVREQYSRLPDFQRLADAHDPDRRFGNAFLERFVYA